MKKLLVILLLVHSLLCSGQFTFDLDQAVVVRAGDNTLPSAWAGGLNTAQYNTMDLDGDGNDDLVLYDRMAKKVVTYLNTSNTWKYAPEYESLFPTEITNWLLLRDFNLDGRKDIFTGDILGMRVFINVAQSDIPQWELFPFFANGMRSEVLLTKGLSGIINLQMQFDDIPGIADADGDGDLDIFSIDYGGSGTVNFHRNYSKERFNTDDSLIFELVDKTWGDFRECTCGVFAFNNEGCSSGGRTKHAGGKSILVFDENGDGNPDLLISEGECSDLLLLINEGTVDAPVFNSSHPYPSTPANFLQYPTGYFEDVDFDGVKDLVATPSVYVKEDIQTNLETSNWFYKNNGSNSMPDFALQGKAFLQEDMIDVGDNSVPAFTDLEGDGDLDLFVSSNNFPATITLLENTGTVSMPEFTLADDDYLGLAAMELRNLKIQLVDLNKDGRRDLAFTAIPFNAGTPGVYVLYNESNGGLQLNLSNVQPISFTVTGAENIWFTDVDADGEQDILKGRNNGAVEYWRNTGSLNFTLTDSQFLGLGANVFTVNPSFATGDLNFDGKADLVIAANSGEVQIYDNYQNFQDGDVAESALILNPLIDDYVEYNLGGRLWPVVANIFSQGRPSLIIGTTMGGLKILRPTEQSAESDFVNVYPNPVQPGIGEVLNILASTQVSLDIFTITGARVQTGLELSAYQTHTFDPGVLARGLYIFRFNTGDKTFVERIVVR
jgi:hypothetical protein